MKKNQMEIVVKLSVSAEKRKALELYCTDFAGTMQKDLQAVAEQILTQKYNKSVPKAVREYVELCSADEENSAGHIFACGDAEFWANSVRFFAISKKDLRRKPPGQTEKARNALFLFAFASIPFLRKNGRSVKITDFLGTP